MVTRDNSPLGVRNHNVSTPHETAFPQRTRTFARELLSRTPLEMDQRALPGMDDASHRPRSGATHPSTARIDLGTRPAGALSTAQALSRQEARMASRGRRALDRQPSLRGRRPASPVGLFRAYRTQENTVPCTIDCTPGAPSRHDVSVPAGAWRLATISGANAFSSLRERSSIAAHDSPPPGSMFASTTAAKERVDACTAGGRAAVHSRDPSSRSLRRSSCSLLRSRPADSPAQSPRNVVSIESNLRRFIALSSLHAHRYAHYGGHRR